MQCIFILDWWSRYKFLKANSRSCNFLYQRVIISRIESIILIIKPKRLIKVLQVVYKDYEIIRLDLPYVPGFLAFREAPHLMKLINTLKDKKPEFIPQVILVDGNGILHQNGFGLASHLGVLADIPTIGCGKTVFYVDGISKDKVRALCDVNLKK